ncbi:unnamed protein product [Paramecium octaurelia]|uniref:Acyl carrier protein n=1 Tax=Paramecium octaurelia TaxID=43137 RepID=A0A8S1XSX1_PAROT|nr:unnamed protein product [Paramecium octaurelia]
MIRKLLSRSLFIRPQFCINHIFDTQDHFKKFNRASIESIKSSVNPLPSPSEEAGLYMEENEVDVRFLKVLKSFEKIDVKSVNWEGDLIKDLGLDSLERIALITSIEHEFTAIFEDRVFDNLKSLQDIKKQILKDDSAF